MSAPATTAAAVEQLARDVAALAERRERGDLAERVREELAREDDGIAQIVVVGEANRGKSSLVNALVGTRELSPVVADVATSCHVILRGGEGERAVLHRRDGGSEDVAIADIPDFATAAGARAGEAKAVEVTVDSPLLRRGLTLIDTPGVGGLVAGHAEITQAALAEADALLFVLDAEAEIGGTEVAFLEQVTERIGTVIFAFSKIDDYPAWRTLLESTRSRLPTRFAEDPIIGVSSERRQRARRAADAGDAERARELFERSGFGELEEALDRLVIGRARQLRMVNLLAACRTALDELAAAERVVTAAADPDLAARQQEAAARLAQLAQATGAIAQDVALDLEQLRLRIVGEYERRAVELERRYTTRINEWEDAFAEEMPALLQSDLDELAGVLHGILVDGVEAIDRSLVGRFGIDESGVELEEDVERISLPNVLPARSDPAAASKKVRRAQLLMMGTMGGGRLAMLGGEAAAGLIATAAVGTVTGGLALAGAVVGISLATVANRFVDRGADRARAQQQAARLLSDAIAEARIQLLTPLSTRVLATRRDFQADVSRRLQQRRAQLQAESVQLKELVTQSRAERDAAQQEATARLAELKPLQDRLAGLWDDLATGSLA